MTEPEQPERPWFAENLPWTETTNWWESAPLAYAAGLAHGAQLEREREQPQIVQTYAEFSAKAVRAFEVVEARKAAA